MPNRVCQHCGHAFQIPDWLVGEDFACPQCGKSMLQPRQGREPNEKIKLVVTPPPENIYPAARLGEIALVPDASPISRAGLLFQNTLFDENAARPRALGLSCPMAHG